MNWKKTTKISIFFILILTFVKTQDLEGDSSTIDVGNNDNSTGNQSKELQIGDRFSVSQIIQANQSFQPVGFFHFQVKQKIPLKDLVISVRGREDYSHSPQLFYSKTNKYPDSSHDISCGINGHDFCVIPSKQIEQDEIFYLGVFCMFSCKFEIAVQYETIFSQMLDEQVRYESANNNSYVLDAKIIFPADLDDSIQHVLIESFILNYDEVKSDFHMYVNKGVVAPTAASYDFSAEALKLNGQSILIEKEEKGFDAGSIFSVSIEAPPQANILLRSESYARERPLYFSKSAEDMVKQGKIRFFKLEITAFTSSEWDFQEISFDLEPFFGNPDLYINHNYLPEDPNNLSSYQWKSTEEDGMESLTISKNLISKQSLIGETFYVAVVGQTAASFRIMAYSSSLSQRQLIFNCVENGYASYSDIIQYQFLLDQETDSDVTVKLFTVQGEAHLFVKMITQDDVNEKSLGLPNFYRSEDHQKQHKISFKFKKSECINSSNVNVCKWVVGVYGESQDQTEYRLLGKHTSAPVQLRENEDHRSMLIEGDSEYYVFSLNQQDESVVKIEFSITSISGEVNIYSSRTNPEPNAVDNELTGNANQDTIAYKTNDINLSLKGSYYIGVKGITGCVYSIHVKIYRKKVDDHVSASMKRVPLGGVVKGFVNYHEPAQFYFTVPEYDRSPVHQTNIVIRFYAHKTEIDPRILIDPIVTINYHISDRVLPVLQAQTPNITQDFIFMKIHSNYTDGGKYVITLNHNNAVYKDYQLKYQMDVNPFNIAFVHPLRPSVLGLELGKYDNYEMYADEPSKVYLEVFECLGKIDVQAASSINAFQSKQYDVKINSPPKFAGDHTIVSYDTNKSAGPVYFSASAIEGIDILQKMKALYMIIPHILPANQVLPHDVYKTPEEQVSTTVSFKINQGVDKPISQVKVDFGALECVNVDSIYRAVQYTYVISLTNNKTLMQYHSKCNMDTDFLQTLGFDLTNHIYQFDGFVRNVGSDEKNYTVNFSGLPNGTYYIQIMSVAFLETSYTNNQAEPFIFMYPMHEFQVGSILQDTNEELVLFFYQWLLVPLGLVLILLVLICIYKQIKTSILLRNYRIANDSKDHDEETANRQEEVAENHEDDQINDDDEVHGNKQVDQLNILK